MRKIWERIIQKEYRPGKDRPIFYNWGTAEVIGLTPGPDFVAPVMALDAIDAKGDTMHDLDETCGVCVKKVKVILTGCAECFTPGDLPLIDIEFFDSVEEAKAHYESQAWMTYSGQVPLVWQPHRQGGEHVVFGQGSVWILPDTIKELEERV